ncbi:DUF4232 domain-containing protein [Pseudofrankia sp. BMG5.37]|uniref:DUF4232 domain-containing protein n=1 Tax=Pseudofrankia sp. BMG5.37 TaxID=3050035 RepID=UPI00289480C3|nr:DUF4232 domain-containing protein [Pseudofrankia sp. BMG5.37]MDT3440398.1 DUF4232 domain-containing protein [Pseudofrankia sp. BMG5.37]
MNAGSRTGTDGGRSVGGRRAGGRRAGGRVVLAALGAAVAVTVTACGDNGGPAGEPPAGTPTASASATATPGAGGPTGSTASASHGSGAGTTKPATTAPAVPTCAASVLAAAIVGSDGAAGTIYTQLTLTNNSSARCTLRGYPGVSFVDTAGNQLGAPADRTGEAGSAVVLAGGGKAQFTVLVTQPGVLPGCDTEGSFTSAANLRIYPPDNTVALLVPVPQGRQACRSPSVHQLKVTSLAAAR